MIQNWKYKFKNKYSGGGTKRGPKYDTSLSSKTLDDELEIADTVPVIRSLSDNWKFLTEKQLLRNDRKIVNNRKNNITKTTLGENINKEEHSSGSSTSKNSIILNTPGSLFTLTDIEEITRNNNRADIVAENEENAIPVTNIHDNPNVTAAESDESIDYNSKEFTSAIFEITSHITNYLTPVNSHKNSASSAGFTRLSKFCFNFYVESSNTIGSASIEAKKMIMNEDFRSDTLLNNCLSTRALSIEKSSSEMKVAIQRKSNAIMFLNQPRSSEPTIGLVNKPTITIVANETKLSDTLYTYNELDTEYRKRSNFNKRAITTENNKANGGVIYIDTQEGKTFLDSLETPGNVRRFDNADIAMDQYITDVRTDDMRAKTRSCAEEYRNPIISEVAVAIDAAVKKLEDTLLSRISQQIKEAIDKLEQISENNMKPKVSIVNSKDSLNQGLQCDLIGTPLVHLAEKGEQVFHYTEQPRSFMMMSIEKNREKQAMRQEEKVLRITDAANKDVKLTIRDKQEKNQGQNTSMFPNFIRYNFQVILFATSFLVGVFVMYRMIDMLF